MRIVIAEDSAVIRAGLVEILADRGHETVAAVGDAEALRAAVDEHEPDVVVVDVRMPPDYTDEGIRAAIAIRREHPGRLPAWQRLIFAFMVRNGMHVTDYYYLPSDQVVEISRQVPI